MEIEIGSNFKIHIPTKMCIEYAPYLHQKSANLVLNVVFFIL